MALFKCKMCGGSLEIPSGTTVIECEYCGTQQTLPKLDDDKRATLYDRANHFRRNNEFDKAMGIYEQILNEDNTDAEAYWSIVLCRYGIEYVEDPSTKRRVPTVNRAQFTSIFDDDNYKSALKYADTYQRSLYEVEAQEINEIQKGILAISQKEEPFDVFICYKESDNHGKRTPDSVLAQDLYYGLKNEGFKVFFARITLEDKLGSAYEPYIFAALNSAKVMVVLGTKPEYFNAVWVKNEWSRYLALIKQGQKKMLIPAYKDMDPYDLPDEFSHLQAQDMSKLGFMQDLIRGIKKIAGKEKKETVKETVIVNQTTHQDHDVAPLLKRAFLFLEDDDFDSAEEYAEKVLDIDPECTDAYIVKLLIDLNLHSPSQISTYATPIDRNPNYVKALRFAKGDARNKIEGYNQAIVDRIDLDNKKQQYSSACSLMNAHKYDEAIAAFSKIKTFKDSSDKIKTCLQNKENDRKEYIYAEAVRGVSSTFADDDDIKQSIAALASIKGYKDADALVEKLEARLKKWYADKAIADERARIKAEQNKKKAKRIAKVAIPSFIALVLIIVLMVTLVIPAIRFNQADTLFAEGNYSAAQKIYSELDGFGKSEQRILAIKAIDQIKSEKVEDAIKTLLSAGTPVELTYNTAGGSLTENNVVTFTKQSQFKGFETPSRNGYRFVEWVFDTYSYDCAEKDAMFYLTLTATWSAKDYTIEYDLTGGVLDGENVDEYDPDDKAFTLLNPTMVGYTFAGWTGTDLDEPTVDVTISSGSYGNRTYTATWKANEYTITYDANGGKAEATQIATYDADVTLLIPERSGYKFLGWYDGETKYENCTWQITNDVTLKAKWEIITYDITYVMNGGTNAKSNPATYTVDTNDITLATPTRTGYNFVGWTYDGQTTPIIELTIEKGSTGKKTLMANWEAISSTITLNPNGGNCNVTTLNVTYDSEFTLPTPTWTGHTFSGWYNGGTKVTSGTCKFVVNTTLVAKWDAVEYTITYTLNGGTNAPSNPKTYNRYDAITLADPTRTGYTFLGWTYSGQTTPTKNVTIAVGTTGNQAYTANWQANSYSITFDANNGTVSPTTMDVTFDTNVTLPTPERTGYTFSGWFAGTKQYTTGTWTTDSNVTLVAKWTANTYKATYNANGGAVSSSNENYTYDAHYTLLEPTRTGYEFLGWYKNGTLVPSSGTWKFDTDISLVAEWKACVYTVTYDAGLGTSSQSSAQATYDSNFTLATASRVGYTFDGWYCGETPYSDGVWKNTSNVTLTAKWTAKTDISYVVNHYQQNANDDGYTLESTLNPHGTADATIAPTVKTFDHFVSPTAQTVTIAPDGSLVVNYYYDRVTYDLTYVTNGGSTIEKQSYKYGQTLTMATTTRTGYTFDGWFADSALASAYPTNATLNKDTSIYARWEANAYTVYFDSNGGSIADNELTVTYDQAYTLPTPVFEGYKFDGWYNGEEEYTNGIWTLANDLSLEAKWCPIPWDGTVDTEWYNNNPDAYEYTLHYASQLAGLAQLINSGVTFEDVTISLDYDIDLANVEWISIGTSESRSFNGTFNGNGYTILNLKITQDHQYSGLFGYNVGMIRDCTVNGYITAAATSDVYCGGIVGYNAGIMEDCNTEIDICISSTQHAANVSVYVRIGGIAGYNSGEIRNCSTSGNIECSETVSSSEGVSASGSATAYIYTGGLIGYNQNGIVEGCFTSGDIIAVAMSRSVSGSFEKYSTSVKLYPYAGGLIGYNNCGEIDNCYAKGSVYAEATYSADDDAVGTCRCYAYAGGLVAYNESGTINNCHAEGLVEANSNSRYEWNWRYSRQYYATFYSGGLIGYNALGAIENSYATGNVIANVEITYHVYGENVSSDIQTYVGGFVGYNKNGTITNGSAIGNITSSVAISNTSRYKATAYGYVGGFVGGSTGEETDCARYKKQIFTITDQGVTETVKNEIGTEKLLSEFPFLNKN